MIKLNIKPTLLLFIVVFFVSSNFVFSQEDEDEKVVSEKMKYFKERYEEEFEADFDKVVSSVKRFIEEAGCRLLSDRVSQNDDGRQRAVFQSELCVITQDRKEAFKMLQKYGVKPPFIRGGV
jgi:hypothetical protein